MTNERPCFACASFHVDPNTGMETCRRPGIDWRWMVYLALWCARQEGSACGPEGRLFQPVLATAGDIHDR